MSKVFFFSMLAACLCLAGILVMQVIECQLFGVF